MIHFLFFLLSAVTSSPVPEAAPGEYIVVLKSALKRRSFEADWHKADKSFNIGDFQAYLYTNISDSTLVDLQNHPSVDYVEGNGQLHAIQGQDTQPNPPSWGLNRVSQRNLPLDPVYTYPSSAGEGVRIYVVDTGIYLAHNDFGGRAVFGVTTNSNGGDDDCNGHGTHCAGTAGGTSYGVAKKATLVHVKVLGCAGSGSFAQVIEGIDWSVRDNAQQGGLTTGVINLSLGGGSSAAVNAAVDAATAGGIACSVAAGNDYGRDACLVSPAGADTAYTVAAADSSDRPASFTNLGPCVNIWAPGVSITSAYIGSPTASRSLSGTSMSAPHVAGALALVLAESTEQLSPQQAMDALTGQGTPNVISGAPSTTINLNLFNGVTDKAATY